MEKDFSFFLPGLFTVQVMVMCMKTRFWGSYKFQTKNEAFNGVIQVQLLLGLLLCWKLEKSLIHWAMPRLTAE